LRVVSYSSISIFPVWVFGTATMLFTGAPPALWLLLDCVPNSSVMLLLFDNGLSDFGLFSAPKGLLAYVVLLLLPSTRFQPSGSGVSSLLRSACEALPLPIKSYNGGCDNAGV
jgi:hypothetical protein